MRTTLELLFGIQPRSGKLLHLLGRLSRYTRPNCEQLEICLDIKHLLCRNQAKIENICRSWRSIWLVTVQCFIVACLAGLNTAASVFFFLTNNEYPDISKSARTSTVVYCSIRINHQMVNFAHAHAMRTRLSNSHPRSLSESLGTRLAQGVVFHLLGITSVIVLPLFSLKSVGM